MASYSFRFELVKVVGISVNVNAPFLSELHETGKGREHKTDFIDFGWFILPIAVNCKLSIGLVSFNIINGPLLYCFTYEWNSLKK